MKRISTIKPTVKYSEDFYNSMVRMCHAKICGDLYTACLWSYFEFTHNLKVDNVKKAKRNHQPIPPLWQWQTNKYIMNHVHIPEGNIRYALDKLSKLGVITLWDYGVREENLDPTDKRMGKIKLGRNPLGGFDQKRWLLYHAEVAQALVTNWELDIKNDKFKVFHDANVFEQLDGVISGRETKIPKPVEIKQKYIDVVEVQPDVDDDSFGMSF